ncbi:putative FBD-associated F-box protein At5g56820 [Miscanthus floridulus]|uniref:putative FBD-associated F-box protein At5g56820 n=1 Tax=Miscanthus floridulus TaxID=154761 RepID=UPI00345AE76D
MPKRSRENCEQPAAKVGSEDRLGSLPDDALLHVLSLLPSEDAVRTCVLARRWRHLWRFTAALRIARDDDKRWNVRWLHRFVTNFLRLRDSLSPLDVCDIFCCPFVLYQGGHAAQAFCFKVAEEWVRRVVSEYRARVLNVWIYTPEDMLEPADAPLVSQHLTRVELGEVELPSGILDLSGCPALEHLELISCRIQGERMLFPSVKHLRITNSSFCIIPRSSISAPSLVSLQLSDNWGFTPVLESMPSLAKAFVRFDDECCDKCPRHCYRIVVMATVMDAMGISVSRMTKTISMCFLGVCKAKRIWS